MIPLRALSILGLLLPAAVWSTDMPDEPRPPVAAMKPYEVKSPFGTRRDEYYWLRDDKRQNPEVLAYLGAENAYKDAMMAHVKPLEDRLYGEIVARIKQDDAGVPYLKRGHWYYWRYETGDEYPVYARKAGSLHAPEQVILDADEIGRLHDFYQVGALEPSPDGQLLAYTEDTVGRRQFTLRFKDLATGRILPDEIPNVESSVAWMADNRTVLYIEKDPQTLLGHKVRRHVLGTDPRSDPVVYDEADESFYVDVGTTKDGRYVYIYVQSTVSSEQRYADATDPRLEFRVILPRERDHEYQADHFEGRWIIRSNWQAPNFRLMEAPVGDSADRSKWRELLAHRSDAFVHDFSVFRGFLAIEERSGGLRKVRIRPWDGGKESYIASDEPAYVAALGENEEVDSHVVRYTYTSLTTPTTIYDYDVTTGERTLLKQTPVLGGFDATRYATEYVWAPARDGEKVPVALVYRKGFRKDGTAPLLQYGYGSYGSSTDPLFRSSLVSLLDRGFVYAIAQVRGGQELGRRWYDAGRLLNKKNSFNDFVDVTRFLVKEGYADPKRVFASGGSAGGLLMGAVINQAPAGLPGHRHARAVRGRGHDHAGRDHPAHHQRVRRVGQSRAEAVLRLHAVVLALRQRGEAGLPGDAGDDGPVGQPGAVLRARQVGGAAAAPEDRRQRAAVPREPGSGPRRQVGPLPVLPRAGRGVRLHPRPGRHQGLTNRIANLNR